MRAGPFEDLDRAPALFRNALSDVLNDASFIGDALADPPSPGDQITAGMEIVRALSLGDRLEFYKEHRVQEQRSWYSKKAFANKRWATRWVIISVAVYIFSAATVLLRIEHPDWSTLPTSPLIVIASSVAGWIQIKKFNELTAAYSLTAHEIGILKNRLDKIESESQLSEFVNDAELAFSREHTQWVARQLG